jgi:hypothetical protein
VGERCISNCDEGKVTPRVRSNLPEENYVEEGGITITITQGEAEMKSDRGGPSLIPTFKGEKPLKPPHGEWQIPVFKEERKARGGEEAEDVPSGAFNPRTGQYYPSTGEGAFDPKTGQYFPPTGGGYFNPRTGEFYPKTGGK